MPELSWPTLQKAALDGAHAGWFRGMDSALLEQARMHAIGRRLLARELAREAAPILFGTYPAVLPHALTGSEWLLLPSDRLASLALDLGALACSAAIRTRIERNQVLCLRRVLGAQRYSQLLAKVDLVADEAESGLEEIQAQLDRALTRDEDLASFLTDRGLAEWRTFLASLHPAAVERVKLSAAPDEGFASTRSRLESQVVARLLAAAMESAQAVAR